MLLLQRAAQSELQSVHMPLATRTNVDLNSRDAHVRVGAAINDQKLVSAERLEARREDHHRLLALPPLALRTGLPRQCRRQQRAVGARNDLCRVCGVEDCPADGCDDRVSNVRPSIAAQWQGAGKAAASERPVFETRPTHRSGQADSGGTGTRCQYCRPASRLGS